MNNYTRNITTVTSIVAIVVGCLALSGWFFNIPLLKSVLSGWASMKFNAAFCFILSGISLYLLNISLVNKHRKLIAIACACIVFLIGFLSISEYIFRYNLHIDGLFWKSGTETGPVSFPDRMSEITSLNFTLLGFILLVLKKRKYPWLVQTLLFVIVPFSMITVFIYFFSTSFLSSIPLLNTTAPHTAILFILLSAGVLYSTPLQYISFSFQKKITGFFLLVSLLLGMIFYTYNKNQEKAIDTSRSLEHTQEVLFKAEELKDQVNEMESGIRGFILTGSENDLPFFSAAADNMDSIIRMLKTMTKDDPGQRQRIDTLEKLIDGYIASQEKLVNIRRKEGFDAAQEVILKGKRILLIGELQSVVTAIVEEEKQLLGKRKAENEKSIQNSSGIIKVFLVFIALLLLVVLSIIYNNTRRRNKAEEQMKEYKYFFNNNNDLCGIANSEGYFEIINTNFIKTLGYTENEFCEIPFIKLIHPDDIPATLHEYAKLKSGDLVINFVNRYRMKDGGYLYLDWNATPNAATGKLYCVARNITERIKADEALQNSLKEVSEYRNALQKQSQAISRANAIIEFDLEGNILTANDNFLNLFGYSLQEIKGKHHRIILKEGQLNTNEYKTFWEHLKKGEFHIGEFERKSKGGQTIWIQGSYNLIYDVENKLVKVFKIVTDITDRKKLEDEIKQFNQELEQKIKERTEELLKSQQLYKNLLDNMNEGFIVDNISGNITFANKEFLKIFGLAEGDLSNLVHEDYFAPEYHEMLRSMHKRRVAGDQVPGVFEYEGLRKDGKRIWLWVHVNPVIENGTVIGTQSLIRDITELKNAEKTLKEYAEELKTSNIELERFAYVASHDLQEPVRMVSSFLTLLEKRLGSQLDETGKQYINFAVDGAGRMKTLIQDLLLYSRVGTNKEDFTSIDLNEVMQYTTRVLEENIKETGTEITVKSLPVIVANKTLTSQLFVNLVSNAIKYHGDKKPEIEIGCNEEGGQWVFYIKDNGIGIDPKYFDKIFIIFKRLHNKSEYSGTGIGLAICKKIVETHKGKIWVESETRKGSIFYFSIPK